MRIVRQLPPLLIAGWLLAGCEPSPPQETDAAPEAVYRHAMDGAPTSLDPAQASSIYAAQLVVNLYDTLYRYRYLERPYSLAPNLAAALPEISDDGLTYTIRLRDDARFIDDEAFEEGRGRPVVAGDVVYSLKRHFDPDTRSQGAWLWQGRIVGLDEWQADGADYGQPVAGLQAVDDHTLRITLTEPYPQFTHTLTHAHSAVVPREAVERHGRGLATRPVGSGPFRLLSFDSARAVLAANEQYRAPPFDVVAEGFAAEHDPRIAALDGRVPPFVDRIEVEFIAEDAARWNALSAGAVDYAKVPVSQFPRVLAQRDPPELAAEFAGEYRLNAAREAGFVHLDFNMADPAIGHHPDPAQDDRNRALRCAIVKAFDWERHNEVFFDGIGTVFPGIIPPAAPEFDPEHNRAYVERDIVGARELLTDHGWNADTLPVLEMGFAASVTARQIFEQLRSFLADIGWPEDKVRPLAFPNYGEFVRAYSSGEVMLLHYSWTMDYPDAQNTVQLFYGPYAAPGANAASFRDTEFDRLYDLARPMPPSEERTRVYRAANQRVMDECVTISGLARTLVLMWRDRAIMQADRAFVGGYGWRFVDVAPEQGGR